MTPLVLRVAARLLLSSCAGQSLTTYAGRLPSSQRQLRAQAWDIGGAPVRNAMSPAIPWMLGASFPFALLASGENNATRRWTSRIIAAPWTRCRADLADRQPPAIQRAEWAASAPFNTNHDTIGISHVLAHAAPSRRDRHG